MQYNKTVDGKYEELKQKNVDTGLGLERATMILQGKNNVFEIEIFKPILEELEKFSSNHDMKSFRIILDHLRASIMLVQDGVRPGNIEQGYILRRLLRRTIRHFKKIGIDIVNLEKIVDNYIDILGGLYPELTENKVKIKNVIEEEKNKFIKTLANGEREFNKALVKAQNSNENIIDGQVVFNLYETYGFPPEITSELAKEQGFEVDLNKFNELYKQHQEKSRAGARAKI